MMEEKTSVLLVEDDPRLGDLLEAYLRAQGFDVSRAMDGREGIARVQRESPALVILDLMLPRVSGLDVLKTIRPAYSGGVLILTADKTEVDQVLGLELGADDYVTKPIEPRVLLARVRSVLRRTARASGANARTDDRLAVGALALDRARREVLCNQRRVDLTGVEFSLLWLLASRAGEVVTRAELYTEALGGRYDGLDRGVDVHLSRLRKKLVEHGFDGTEIKSVRGAGYLFARS